MNLRKRARKITNRAIRELGRKNANQASMEPRKPIKLRKYAKPKDIQAPVTPPKAIQNPAPVSELATTGLVQNPTTLNAEKDFEDLYTRIKSVPNYTAKLAEFLRQNKVHSTHRRIVKRKFPRRKIIVHFPFQIFMGDLIEYLQPSFKHANRNNGYILVLIDTFTKMAYARPVKKKDKFSVSIALKSILDNLEHYPNTLITDEGLEFYNKNVQEILDDFGIHHYSIKSKMKASIIERFNRTLRQKLEKYFVKNNTKNWVDVLDKFIENYNNTPHRSIGMAPSAVSDENSKQVFKHLFPDIELETQPRLSKGNIVRILKEKTIFQKGYVQSWTDECFKISAVKQAAGRVWYELEDLAGQKLSGIKYYWELNLVSKK